jgi:hypothetical protein
VFRYCAYLSGVFAQETYHDNEDFTQKTIFVLVSESSLFLMAPDIALIMVLMVPGASRRVQCIAIKDRERRSIGVYPVQPDGSRPRENVFTIYENKRICPKQSKFGVDEQSSQGCWISQEDCSIDLEAYAKLQNIQNYVSLSTTSFRNSCAFGLDTILGKMM